MIKSLELLDMEAIDPKVMPGIFSKLSPWTFMFGHIGPTPFERTPSCCGSPKLIGDPGFNLSQGSQKFPFWDLEQFFLGRGDPGQPEINGGLPPVVGLVFEGFLYGLGRAHAKAIEQLYLSR